MRIFRYIFFFFIFLSLSCSSEPRKKIYIKSVKLSDKIRIDWYVYSSITSFAPDYLQINTNEVKPFFTSFYLTNIKFKNDSLYISLWKNGYSLTQTFLNNVKVAIDTNGKQWNDATSRIGRLQRKHINTDMPHYTNTYCPNGECYNFDTSTHYK